MPIIGGSSSRFDESVEKVTHETNTSENWALILDICDGVKESGTAGAKDILLSMKKRLNNRDPHVVMLTLSLLDSCMSNCGTIFKTEAASKEFVGELKSKATGSNHKIAERTRQLLKRWVDEEYMKDPMLKLSLLVHLYNDLKTDGFDFPSSVKAKAKVPSDPNYASSQEEADDIAKAIQLSLKESGGTSGSSNSSAANGAHVSSSSFGTGSSTPLLYPSNSHGIAAPPARRIVKALYDFEAAEDNELTFTAAELITVIDDSDVNWWKGSNHRGEGLFPASFVTSDLTAPVEEAIVSTASESRRKSVQFNDEVEVKTVDRSEEEQVVVKIDESKLDWCLNILQDADPTGDRPDPDELPRLEDNCHVMGPLIDKELEAIDAKHNQLAELNVRLIDALNLYHSSMKSGPAQSGSSPTVSQPPKGAPGFTPESSYGGSYVSNNYGIVPGSVAGPQAGTGGSMVYGGMQQPPAAGSYSGAYSNGHQAGMGGSHHGSFDGSAGMSISNNVGTPQQQLPGGVYNSGVGLTNAGSFSNINSQVGGVGHAYAQQQPAEMGGASAHQHYAVSQ